MRICSFLSTVWLGMVTLASAQPSAITQWALPNGLQEISGLAVASPTSVYAHNDEYAIIYEVELTSGKVVRAFALGDPTVAADFEGIAAADGRVYLITSDGMLYEANIGEHRTRERYNFYDTGIGEFCEIEGLSRAPAPGEFLILCKQALREEAQRTVQIYRWSLADRRAQTDPWLEIPHETFLPAADFPGFRPAGLEWDAFKKRLVIISSRNSTLYFFDEHGAPVSTVPLPKVAHAQSEGVAVLANGDIIVADEGAKRSAGKLSTYRNLP